MFIYTIFIFHTLVSTANYIPLRVRAIRSRCLHALHGRTCMYKRYI